MNKTKYMLKYPLLFTYVELAQEQVKFEDDSDIYNQFEKLIRARMRSLDLGQLLDQQGTGIPMEGCIIESDNFGGIIKGRRTK